MGEEGGDRAYIAYITYSILCLLLSGSFWAALLGILNEVTLAGMSLTIAQNIWLGWWIGDYVDIAVLGPFLIFFGCQYIHKFIVPEDIFLLHYSLLWISIDIMTWQYRSVLYA